MKNSLEIMCPEIAKQWSTRNFPSLPKDISYGSNKKVWWRGECGHEWQASPHSRTGKILLVVRIVPETVCLPILMTLHRGFRRSRQSGRIKTIHYDQTR